MKSPMRYYFIFFKKKKKNAFLVIYSEVFICLFIRNNVRHLITFDEYIDKNIVFKNFIDNLEIFAQTCRAKKMLNKLKIFQSQMMLQ